MPLAHGRMDYSSTTHLAPTPEFLHCIQWVGFHLGGGGGGGDKQLNFPPKLTRVSIRYCVELVLDHLKIEWQTTYVELLCSTSTGTCEPKCMSYILRP
jgi:hypothetical protein